MHLSKLEKKNIASLAKAFPKLYMIDKNFTGKMEVRLF